MNKEMIRLQIAIKTIFAHKLRNFLSTLAIIIGIMAVIMVMSAGLSLKQLILDQVEAFGSNWIEVEIKTPNTSHTSTENAAGIAQGVIVTTLTTDDADEIKKLPNISQVYSGMIGQSLVTYQETNKQIQLFGVSATFPEIDTGELAYGEFYTDEEERSLSQVAVLGWNVAEDLFGNDDPIGKNIKIKRQNYRVIGVMEERGGSPGFDFDEMVFVPLKTLQKKILGIDHIFFIIAQVDDPNALDESTDEIRFLIRDRHDTKDLESDDFAVISSTESIEMIDTILGGLNLLLVAIAAVSLIVGGIGIMNIMYVSVTERTFEIGLRKSVGASRTDIIRQFLWESVILTLIGGLIGVAMGISFSFLVSVVAQALDFPWPFAISIQSIFIATIFSASVGLLFGIYPARKAGSLDPIEALRKD